MQLFTRSTRRNLIKRLLPQAREIASRSVADVWARVRDLIFDMDLPEARGYVRARAASVLRQQTTQFFAANPGLDAYEQRVLVAMVAERTVHLVVSDVISRHSTIRRAA